MVTVMVKEGEIHISFHPTPLQTSFPEPSKYFGTQVYRGLRPEYWCSLIATQGCDDPRVMLWLQAEYATFRAGDVPSKVGAGRVLHLSFSSLFSGFHSHLPRSATRVEFSTPLTAPSKATSACNTASTTRG